MSSRILIVLATGIVFALGNWCVAAQTASGPANVRIKEIEVKIAEVVAGSTVEIDLAKLTLRMHQLRLDRLKKMDAAAAQGEMEQAEIEMQMAVVNLKAAEERRMIRMLELDRARAELELARASAR